MQLRWEAAGKNRRLRKDAVESASLCSKTESCLSFPETERWSWACPSTVSKWPHWTNVWVEPCCILQPSGQEVVSRLSLSQQVKMKVSYLLSWPGRAASTPSLPDRAHVVLRWRPGRRKEPPGSQDHGRTAGRVQHLGVPVQQLGGETLHSRWCQGSSCYETCFFFFFFFLGAGSVHLQGAVGLLRLCSVLRQVLMVGQTEEIWGDKRNHCKWQHQISATVRICFHFLSFFPSVYHQMLTEWW